MPNTSLMLILGCMALLLAPLPKAFGENVALQQDIKQLDKNMAITQPGDSMLWYDIRNLGIEGRGWPDTAHPYDRLPARAKGVVREPVWFLGQYSAGLCVRFVTDAKSIAARWTLRFDSLAMDHMPATGVSGLDLYVQDNGTWHWLAVGRPTRFPENRQTLAGGLAGKRQEYLLYLPLYNGVESVQIGVPPDAMIAQAPFRRVRPICFYGTSITHGGCAARPGMAYPSILSRRLDRPVINLGFSGNGPMDLEVGRLIAELDVSLYVIDCLPNMNAQMVAERTEPFVRILREARPDTPIVLIENIVYQNARFVAASHKRYTESNVALHEAYRRLVASGVKKLYYVRGEKLLGTDGEATVDGTHPTDLGFLRMADALQPVLKRFLKAEKSEWSAGRGLESRAGGQGGTSGPSP